MSGAPSDSMQEAEAFVQSRLRSVMDEWYRKGMAEGRLLERHRISSIFRHPAVIGREHMALQLAYATDLTVEEAVAQLEASRPTQDQLEN